MFLAAALGLALVLRVRGLAILEHPVHGALLLPTLTERLGPVPSPDSCRLPARLAAAAPGGRHLRGADPRHPGGVGAAGSDALATRARAGGDRVRRWSSRPGNPHLRPSKPERGGPPAHAPRAPARVRGDAVLDGTALYVFRPAAYRHGALIRGVREWVARGVIPEEAIADDMRAARAPVAHVDFRIRGMIGPVADLLRQHYVAGPEGLLVAGAEIAADAGGGRSVVNLLAVGPLSPGLQPGARGVGRRDSGPARVARAPPGPARDHLARVRRYDPTHRRHLPGAAGTAGERRLRGRRA